MFANEILIIFLQDFTLPKLLVTSDFKGQSVSQLTCKKGEIILLISKTVQGYVTLTNYKPLISWSKSRLWRVLIRELSSQLGAGHLWVRDVTFEDGSTKVNSNVTFFLCELREEDLTCERSLQFSKKAVVERKPTVLLHIDKILNSYCLMHKTKAKHATET